MSERYLGEIRIVAFNFVPSGWALCNGQLLSIQQNAALFSILGTTYGGNGVQTFGLPDLRGRIPLHVSADIVLGEFGGEVSHTLTVSEIPGHTHQAMAQTVASNPGGTPANSVWATSTTAMFGATATTTMSSAAIAGAGGNQAHPNEAPYLALTFAIALTGIFPSRP
jgi:microcystin-dependent protein